MMKTDYFSNLTALFKPKSICVIGASIKPGKVGYDIFKNIIDYGFNGKLYPINPSYDFILGYKCYPTVLDVKQDIDLAIIAIPAKFVIDVAKQCGESKVKNLVIISAGFKEVGREGAKLEKQLIDLSKEYGFRIQGPNCLGVIDTNTPVNASFAGQMPIKGNIAFISQSGAMGTAILDWSFDNNIGFSKFISLGNKADLNESDFILYLGEDNQTKVILVYIEDVRNGQQFIDTIRRTIPKKPILILKSGKSVAGQKAAVSHTGSLAGSNISYQTTFKQYGVIEVNSISDLFDYAKVFSTQPIPKDNSICILTNAGGPGIVATDSAEKNNLNLRVLKESTLQELQNFLPSSASIYNPVDILGDAQPEIYSKALGTILRDENISSIIILLSPQVSTKPTETALEIVKLNKIIDKPLVCVFMGGPQVTEAKKILAMNRIPVFNFPEDAVESISALVKYKHMCEIIKELKKVKIIGDKNKVKSIIEKVLAENRYSLIGSEASQILESYNIKTAKTYLAENSEEALIIADKIGYPVVLKIASPDILHKSDFGGVILNIKNEKELRESFIGMISNSKKLFPNARIYGIDVQEQGEKGKEIIIGVNKGDPFGHLLMFGLGGIYVNFLKDVSFRLIPIYENEALKMIAETKTYQLLKGVRGEAPSDIDSIINTIYSISQLIEDFPIISELDINPLFVYNVNNGCLAVDVKITLYKEKE
jgi:acetyl coenzyme A synthetase (ADP forming)-like protein